MKRTLVILAALLPLGGCVHAGFGAHDFSGGFVGVTGGAVSTR